MLYPLSYEGGGPRLPATPAPVVGENGSMDPSRRISLFGISIDNLTMAEAVADVIERAREQRRTVVSFVNAHCVNIAWNDPAYLAALRSGDRTYADGSGMRLAGRLLGQPLRDNVNGTDMFPALVSATAGTGLRLYLLGARPGVADAVAEWIHDTSPATVVAGTDHGYHGADGHDGVIDRIRAARADLLFVAMGVPDQDEWLVEHLESTGATVGLGIGGLFDMVSGRIPRAPRWMRRLGVEWVWRLAKEPRRMWQRYLVGNVVFVGHALHQRLFGLPGRLRPPPESVPPSAGRRGCR
jgi:N-acetylglucosaminyldiphosphoundecaprenol N-acetyl-beta-D-mannosaminyltransferase